MGRQKVLLPYRGTTVLEYIMTQVLGLVDEVVVVLGHAPEAVTAVLSPYPVRLVVNTAYQEGMLTSVRAGLGAVDARAGAFLLLLGDQPQVRRDVVASLIAQYRSQPGGILLPAYQGKSGHPPIIAMRYRHEILSGFEDCGLRGLYAAHPDAVKLHPVEDEGIMEDMDTPEDYARLLLRAQKISG